MQVQPSCFERRRGAATCYQGTDTDEEEEMNTPILESDYMLFFRGTDWQRRLSPEEFQKLVSDWANWFEGLKQEGRCTGGHPLRLPANGLPMRPSECVSRDDEGRQRGFGLLR
jgi:hypothetical protein